MNFIFLGAQEQEVWKSFIPAIGPIVAALITTIGVIWTARSSLKRLKIDQKATPTENNIQMVQITVGNGIVLKNLAKRLFMLLLGSG